MTDVKLLAYRVLDPRQSQDYVRFEAADRQASQ